MTPAFNTHLPYRIVNGEERQADKMGDYTQLVANASGADVAYTATYNGEQDVYYLKVFPDCNENGVSDVDDIAHGSSLDTNNSHMPDECEINILVGDLDKDNDVDRDDMNILMASRNQPANEVDDPKDLDGDGTITVLDARKLRLLCTRNRCATQ